MNCSEAGCIMDEYLDKELESSASLQVEAHLKGCSRCFGRAEFDLAVRRIFKLKLNEMRASESFKNKLFSRLGKEKIK